MNTDTAPIFAEQDVRALHSGSTARVLDVMGRFVGPVLMVTFGVTVLIAVGWALATRPDGPAPSAPVATPSARDSVQPAPGAQSAPGAPPAPMPQPAPAPQTAAAPAPANPTRATPVPAPAAAVPMPATPAPKPASPGPRPAPSAPAPAPAAKAPSSHTVAAGDTLAGIGLRYQVGFEQIAAANAVAKPQLIRPGQQLSIPQRAANTIVIAPGDTLAGLAQRAGTTVEALQALNPQITNPNRITAGGQLRVA